MRNPVLRSAVLAAILAFAGQATAQETKPTFTFAFHGFIGGSLYADDANLGLSPGQAALFVRAQTSAAAKQPNQDKLVLGGDVRQTRLNFSLAGPKVFGGATPKGVVELDFFGGGGLYSGFGSFGDVSLLPRIRLSYAELAWENTTFRFGQDINLTFALAPATVGHLAFPLTYGAGSIGWRYPGVEVFQRMPMGDMKLELALQLQRGGWRSGDPFSYTAGPAGAGAIPAGANDRYNNGLGDAGSPIIQARATIASGTTFSLFVAGHYNSVDRSGVDNVGTGCTNANTNIGACKDLQVVAGNAGLKAVVGPLTLQGSAYVGKNTANLLGNIIQFQAPTIGDVHEWGGWAQLGFNLTKEFSAWALVGTEHPNYQEANDAKFNYLQNTMFSGMLRYMEGGYAIGAEWTHWLTKTRVYTGAATPTVDTALTADLQANQLMVSGYYFF